MRPLGCPTLDMNEKQEEMPERLTKNIEVEEDGPTIQEQVHRPQDLRFREFFFHMGVLVEFGLSDTCKGCGSAASAMKSRWPQTIVGETETAGDAVADD